MCIVLHAVAHEQEDTLRKHRLGLTTLHVCVFFICKMWAGKRNSRLLCSDMEKMKVIFSRVTLSDTPQVRTTIKELDIKNQETFPNFNVQQNHPKGC